MEALFGSSGAEAIFVFQAAVDGNGTNPLRLASSPKLMPPQVGPPVDTVTATVTEANFVESSVEVAVIVAVSAPVLAGVKVTPVPEVTPVGALSEPSAAGLTARFTVFV
jgi:hypothetical protein